MEKSTSAREDEEGGGRRAEGEDAFCISVFRIIIDWPPTQPHDLLLPTNGTHYLSPDPII